VECEVLVEKILEVGEGRKIVKTFLIMERVRNTSIALTSVALFLSSSKSHKIKIPIVSTKSST
jgi:hypothetical protein